MNAAKRIYCIEGIYTQGSNEVEPSVRPFLEQLRSQDLWSFVCRDCATVEELKYYLQHEWPSCAKGSVLYISAHGFPGGLEFSKNERIHLGTLQLELQDKCVGCLVHISGCSVFAGNDRLVKDFRKATGAMGVSGYEKEVGFGDYNWAPSLALELVMLGSIASERINLSARTTQKLPLRRLRRKLGERFPDCGLRMHFDFDK